MLWFRRTATLEDRMHHLETLIQAIPPAVFAAQGALTSITQVPDTASSPLVPFMYPDGMPSGVPPPSLHVFPLMNPSTHFTREPKVDDRRQSPRNSFNPLLTAGPFYIPQEQADERVSLTASYLYFDDEGYTRWQGETSGLPVLDLLVERHTPARPLEKAQADTTSKVASAANAEWFPNRQLRRTDVNPQTLWRLITSFIVPELMDR